jgi:hypothetical protein
VLLVRRSAQGVFASLGVTLEEVAAAVATRDTVRAEAALAAARQVDEDVRALDEALALGRETARFSLARRSARAELDRFERGARHVDYAARNTRVLARHAVRFLRARRDTPPALGEALSELSAAVWALASHLDEPGRGGDQVRVHASRAAARAVESFESEPDLGLAEIATQVRSTAIDLARAAEAGAREPAAETPTEELLLPAPA